MTLPPMRSLRYGVKDRMGGRPRASVGNLYGNHYGNLCGTGLLAYLGSLLFGVANLTLVAGGTW